MKKTAKSLFVTLMMTVSIGVVGMAEAQVLSDYTAYPPFVNNSVAPNIMLVLDHSASMQLPAYVGCVYGDVNWNWGSGWEAVCDPTDSTILPANAYKTSQEYYGYFKNDKYYSYGPQKFTEDASCYNPATQDPKIGGADCYSGNLMNWATMTRLDLMRKALIGGKSVSPQGNAHTLLAAGAGATFTDYNLSCTFKLDRPNQSNLYRDFSISDAAGGGGANCDVSDSLKSDDFNNTSLDVKWTAVDIGTTTIGSQTETVGGTLDVSSDGSQIWGTSDNFRFVYQSFNKNFDLRLRIISPPIVAGEPYAKAALVVRESTDADSRQVHVAATQSEGLQFAYRATDGGTTNTFANYVNPVTYPIWVRLTRAGDSFTAYHSTDGVSWTQAGSINVNMSDDALVGMGTASYLPLTSGTGIYDEFIYCVEGCAVGTLSGANVQVELPEKDRKGIIQAVTDKDEDGVIDADAPRFGVMVYNGSAINGCIRVGIEGASMSALLNAIQNETAQSFTHTGAALEEAIDYFAQNDSLQTEGLQFAYRATDGGTTNTFANYVNPVTYPIWVRLTRAGDSFTAYHSTDGVSWTQAGSINVNMSDDALVGMGTASYLPLTSGTGIYDEFIYCVEGCAVGTLSGANVQVELPEKDRKGIIQAVTDKDEDGVIDADAPRFGVMVYNGSAINGCIRVGIEGASMSALLNAIQNETAQSFTHTGAALEEAIDYFAQNDSLHNNCDNTSKISGPAGNMDPFYDSGSPVACRKCFVLLISDGEWTDGTTDPVKPAHEGHITDLRPEAAMPGTQNLEIYSVFTFGASGAGRNAMQQIGMYGGYKDHDASDFPYTGEPEPADSRNVVLPDALCDPAGTWTDECKEWDKDADGIPDHYFEASEGNELEAALISAISAILKKAASGTSVSVLSTSGEGDGALYQAFFFPSQFEGFEELTWLGYVQGLFLDKNGNLREDTNGNDQLDLSSDKIVNIVFDDVTGETKVERFADNNGDANADSSTPESTIPLDQLIPIWEAGKELAKRTAASRTIWTTTDNSSLISFDNTAASTLKPYLRAATDAISGDIIDFIRGEIPVDGNGDPIYRNRSITVDGNLEVWKLGDIVYSTPTPVSSPRESYNLIYSDSSYQPFLEKYRNRRTVIYVGANDGMLHAFNAGCYDDSIKKFYPNVDGSGNCTTGGSWALGDEMWGFIPQELLPHLEWLTMKGYTHIFYNDLKPKITDAKLWGTGDGDHPGGWGTILIGGMRLGGGSIDDSNGTTHESSYYVLDITNPEIKPTLLGVFTDPDLGFTMSEPAVGRVKESAGNEKWFMIAGSGPTDYDGNRGSSNMFGADLDTHIFVWDLESGALTKIDTGDKGYMGNVITLDGNLDYSIDTVYVGSGYSQGVNENGKLYRVTTKQSVSPASWVLSTAFNATGPVLVSPSIAIDGFSNIWVYFGSGRFIAQADKLNTDDQGIYAIKDPCWYGDCTTTVTGLKNVTDIAVDEDESLSGSDAGGYTDFGELLDAMRTSFNGWEIDLLNGERVLSKPAVLGGVVLTTTFVPDVGDICAFQGKSNLYAMYYETGTAYIKDVIGTTGTTINRKISLGEGVPTAVGLHIGAEEGTKGFVQQGTGAISQIDATPPLDVKTGVVTWEEKRR